MSKTTLSLGGVPTTIFYKQRRFIDDIFTNREYEKVFGDLVVVDIGANIGAFSYWIYDKARAVYAIEPSTENVEYMIQTKTFNTLDRLHPRCLGISGTGGMRAFHAQTDPAEGGWSMDLHPLPSSQHTLFPTKTLAQFMEDEKIEYIDILKIDVEGAEKEIFASEGFTSVSGRIATIVGETHAYDAEHDLTRAGFRVTCKSPLVARRI